MKISVGSDHCGYGLKIKMISKLKELGHEVVDYGCYDRNPVDFPDIAKLVCSSIVKGEADRGIMFCGTGVGAAIACNKFPGIRASVCHDIYSAHQCVEHDDVKVMCIGEQIVGEAVAYDLIVSFLQAQFSTDPDFRRRVKKLIEMESK